MQKFTLNNENVYRKATDYLSMSYSHGVTANNLKLKRCFSRYRSYEGNNYFTENFQLKENKT